MGCLPLRDVHVAVVPAEQPTWHLGAAIQWTQNTYLHVRITLTSIRIDSGLTCFFPLYTKPDLAVAFEGTLP